MLNLFRARLKDTSGYQGFWDSLHQVEIVHMLFLGPKTTKYTKYTVYTIFG